MESLQKFWVWKIPYGREPDNDRNDQAWSGKFLAPKNSILFFWLVTANRILTNSRLSTLAIHSARLGEDIIHLLRDCPFVQDVWGSVGVPTSCVMSFSAPILYLASSSECDRRKQLHSTIVLLEVEGFSCLRDLEYLDIKKQKDLRKR